MELDRSIQGLTKDELIAIAKKQYCSATEACEADLPWPGDEGNTVYDEIRIANAEHDGSGRIAIAIAARHLGIALRSSEVQSPPKL